MLLNAPPPASVRAALLVDADNFHRVEDLRAIHSQFGQIAGKGFLCHVYGDVKVLSRDELRPVWQEMAARLLPCLPLNKNTTDAMLIIDALLLHFQQGVRRFGIASGDADFAPLALQLRALGCEVTGFARKSIAFDAMVSYYDRTVRFEVPAVPPSATAPPCPPPTMESPAVAKAALKPDPAPVKVAVSPKSASAEAEGVARILAALPPWLPHTVRPLNVLGAPLRAAGIKTGNTPLHQMFRQYPDFFTVLASPLQPDTPVKVRLERRP